MPLLASIKYELILFKWLLTTAFRIDMGRFFCLRDAPDEVVLEFSYFEEEEHGPDLAQLGHEARQEMKLRQRRKA